MALRKCVVPIARAVISIAFAADLLKRASREACTDRVTLDVVGALWDANTASALDLDMSKRTLSVLVP